ncbi:unnamed protein product [Arctogadus glacialis]
MVVCFPPPSFTLAPPSLCCRGGVEAGQRSATRIGAHEDMRTDLLQCCVLTVIFFFPSHFSPMVLLFQPTKHLTESVTVDYKKKNFCRMHMELECKREKKC